MSAKSYYELHITMVGNPVEIEPLVKSIKWKFSKIDGDPSLGDGIKCYATKHFNSVLDQGMILNKLLHAATHLQEHGCNVVRRKVEWVIWDDRSNTVRFECNGLCPECSK